MNNPTITLKTITLFVVSFCAGAIFFAWYHEWIILYIPSRTIQTTNQDKPPAIKKTVPLYFWRHGKWEYENIETIIPQNLNSALVHVINKWLALMEEEQLIHAKIRVQSAIFIPLQQDLYLSFDRTPFSASQSTQEKIFFIHGILKTIAACNFPIQRIQFLVHHQPINDYHLDLSFAWPLDGFLKEDQQEMITRA